MRLCQRTPVIYSARRPREDSPSPLCRVCLIHLSSRIICSYCYAQGAAGEGAFMTGFERNADIVFAASYAPLLGVSPMSYAEDIVAERLNRVWTTINGYCRQYLPMTLSRVEFTRSFQTPNLIAFNAESVFLSTSYYVQQVRHFIHL